VTILTVIAVLSILVGNFLAVKQVNLKRILAYSSIAHFGYLLIGLISMTYASLGNVSVYVITYVLTTIGAFGAVALMSSPYNNVDEAEILADYRGLFWRRPVLTAVLTVMMLSLAGIPLTAGFIGKFLVVMAIAIKQLKLSGLKTTLPKPRNRKSQVIINRLPQTYCLILDAKSALIQSSIVQRLIFAF
jgi:NADH-quinone oxidoreductase subunit N